MGRVVGPNFSRSDDRGPGRPGTPLRRFFASFVDIFRRYGWKGLAALVVAALFAFAPLTLLYGLNELRLTPVMDSSVRGPVVVKPGRYQDEQKRDEPGETALLKIVCRVASLGESRPLLLDDDPQRDREGSRSSMHVRYEKAYVRPAGLDPPAPFALLGKPPVSVWLPAGEYEVLIVHDAPRSEPRLDARSHGFPLLSTFASCTLENKRTTVCEVPLAHYDWGFDDEPLQLVGDDGSTADRPPKESESARLAARYAEIYELPTPGGYVLALEEPVVRHAEGHRGCTVDFAQLRAVPREWTRDQLATLRNWLPDDAIAARANLTSLVDRLGWREFLQGWFCYAAAGVAGLVFTRWGALALLEPWRRGESLRETVALLGKIAALSVVAWLLLHIVCDTSGCSGQLPLRLG